jgi:hypothetical protein
MDEVDCAVIVLGTIPRFFLLATPEEIVRQLKKTRERARAERLISSQKVWVKGISCKHENGIKYLFGVSSRMSHLPQSEVTPIPSPIFEKHDVGIRRDMNLFCCWQLLKGGVGTGYEF